MAKKNDKISLIVATKPVLTTTTSSDISVRIDQKDIIEMVIEQKVAEVEREMKIFILEKDEYKENQSNLLQKDLVKHITLTKDQSDLIELFKKNVKKPDPDCVILRVLNYGGVPDLVKYSLAYNIGNGYQDVHMLKFILNNNQLTKAGKELILKYFKYCTCGNSIIQSFNDEILNIRKSSKTLKAEWTRNMLNQSAEGKRLMEVINESMKVVK